MTNQSDCVAAAAPSCANGGDVQLERALGLAYPIPDNPHASVIDRAHHNRAAFERGWIAKTAAQEDDARDALGAILWMYRRLPQAYGCLPSIEACIKALASQTGQDVTDDLRERQMRVGVHEHESGQGGARPEAHPPSLEAARAVSSSPATQQSPGYADSKLACSDCGLTMGESYLLSDLKAGKIDIRATAGAAKRPSVDAISYNANIVRDEMRRAIAEHGKSDDIASGDVTQTELLRAFGLKIGYEIGGWVDASDAQPDVEAIVNQMLATQQSGASKQGG